MDKAIELKARLIETLTSALYAEPIVVFREYVQNSVDSHINATKRKGEKQVDFKIQINIDKVNKSIVIRDNGFGIQNDKFESTMRKLGGTADKPKDNVGLRGIGRLSGMPFCDKVIFKNKDETFEKIQRFVLEGKKYDELLEKGLDLEEIFEKISPPSEDEENSSDDTHFFEVTMENVHEELLNYIFAKKNRRGKKSEMDNQPTATFKEELKILLPLPYHSSFEYGKTIHKKYSEIFREELEKYEFEITLNGELLYKPFNIDKSKKGQYCSLVLKLPRKEGEEMPIAMVWYRMNYVFKSIGDDYGIDVRNKNFLMKGKSALADEAQKSDYTQTTHSQYISALKGVRGEMLISPILKDNKPLLEDNSRRDWFRIDKNSMILTDMICQLLNDMHDYRYKASKVFNKLIKDRSEEEKEKLYESLLRLTDNKNINEISKHFETNEKKELTHNVDEPDIVADYSDIPTLIYPQQEIYKKIMLIVYNYLKDNKGIKLYYGLKAYLIEQLNAE